MGELFGTDGIRGIAGRGLDAPLAYRLGIAAAEVLTDNGGKPKILIGRDTRISGDMLESAITAGICSAGGDVVRLGVVPTPAVAYLVGYYGADAGVMISASHNPSEYNGIKLFDGAGMKLSDDIEDKIEQILLTRAPGDYQCAAGASIGRVFDGAYLPHAYNLHVSRIMKSRKTDGGAGRRVLFDLANGSASATAKEIFTYFDTYGFSCDFIADTPSGININERCGSTDLKSLSDSVTVGGYDIGVAFDGDADRCLCVDEKGRTIDGDMLIGLLALELKKQERLDGNTAVVTCMSNLGFHIMAKENGVNVAVTKVGDRYVLEEMLKNGYKLGGEQSGHIIMTDYATTGDGQITAAMVLGILAQSGKKASELFDFIKILPQVSISVEAPAEKKRAIPERSEVRAKVSEVEERLRGRGRVLIRPSGTENLIRVMLEGEDRRELETLAAEIADTIKILL